MHTQLKYYIIVFGICVIIEELRMALWKILVQLFMLCLLFQSSVSEVRIVDWTIGGVSALNNRIEVRLGDSLVFRCGSTYSNVVLQRSAAQFVNCNSSQGPQFKLVGSCTTFHENATVIEIEQASAKLNSSTSFSPNETVYFASLSNGTLFGAFNHNISGGECSDGLKLEVYIKSITTTTQAPSPTTVVVSSTTEKSTSPSSELPKDDKTTTKVIISGPQGVVDSDTPTHAHFSLLCLVLCLLLTYLLR